MMKFYGLLTFTAMFAANSYSAEPKRLDISPKETAALYAQINAIAKDLALSKAARIAALQDLQNIVKPTPYPSNANLVLNTAAVEIHGLKASPLTAAGAGAGDGAGAAGMIPDEAAQRALKIERRKKLGLKIDLVPYAAPEAMDTSD